MLGDWALALATQPRLLLSNMYMTFVPYPGPWSLFAWDSLFDQGLVKEQGR